MLQRIRQTERKVVGFDDLRRAVPKWTRVILYDNLPADPTKIFVGPTRALIVLYMMKGRSVGHYSAILKRGGQFEYFSSYALRPEAEMAALHESPGKMLRLLGSKYTQTKVRLQPMRNSNTCARWALARVSLDTLNVRDFVSLFSRKLSLQTPDDICTLSTIFAL